MSESIFVADAATFREYRDLRPVAGADVVILDGARVIGDVTLGAGVNVWYNAVMRGDVHWIRIGEDTNIQDNSVLHVTHDEYPLTIGARVTIGHATRIHGCTIEDEAQIGIAATVLDGAVVESRAIVAAGAVVPPRMRVERGQLVAGVPARVIRAVRQAEIDEILTRAVRYRAYAHEHAASCPGRWLPASRPPIG